MSAVGKEPREMALVAPFAVVADTMSTSYAAVAAGCSSPVVA